MKLYISGRISGRPTKLAQAEFGEAEAKIRKFGLIPVNPMNNGLPADTEWEDQMGQDIAMLLRCDAIYMLPGWQQMPCNPFEQFVHAPVRNADAQGSGHFSDEVDTVHVLRTGDHENVFVLRCVVACRCRFPRTCRSDGPCNILELLCVGKQFGEFLIHPRPAELPSFGPLSGDLRPQLHKHLVTD